MRINKYIATNTSFSRRKADQLIEEGQVFLNGKKLTKLGSTIDPEKDTITIKNKKITPKSSIKKIYLALNKPEGYITTRSDELNRPTIMNLIPKNQNLKPVGRLDKNTEGLILLSNDGDFIHKLTHPKFECQKEYFIKIEGRLNEENQKKLESGIKIDQKITAPSKIKIINKSQKETILTITIHEGRNRQIRKMFASIKQPVKYLRRIRIGKIQLGNLQVGQYRPLTPQEINVN